MAHFVADDIGALARIDRAARRRAVEEVEGFAIVIGVQISSFIEQNLKYCTDLPFRQWHSSGPIVSATPKRFGRSPITKFRGSRLIRGGWRCRPWKGICQGSLRNLSRWAGQSDPVSGVVFPSRA